MIDSATCNATHPAGCPSTPPPTVDVGANPSSAELDHATHTVYVSTFGAANGWAVFDADTCDATVHSGCATQGVLTGDPSGPNDAAIDEADETLYTANYDNTVSAFDLRQCNAADLGGCAAQAAGVVTPFPDPSFNENTVWIAVDPQFHTVYAVYNRDDTLVAIDTRVCNGGHLAACATLDPPTIHTGEQPEGAVLDPGTQTLYVADQFGNDVSVIDAARCNAAMTVGCRRRPPAVPLVAPGGVAVDTREHTAYVTAGPGAMALIDTRRCSAWSAVGCAAAPPTVAAGDTPVAVAVSHRTHTIYVADYGSGSEGSVAVLDARACDAAHPAGCALLHTLPLPGGHPDDLAVDPLTGTLYVATVAPSGPNLVSVFDAATCDATNAAGCAQKPNTVAVGDSGDGSSALSIALNPLTDTLYATNLVTAGPGAFTGSSVYVIDGARCSASVHSGCSQIPAVITVPATESSGSTPVGVAVDPLTDTVYTADLDGGDVGTGTVAVIDGATCNGHATAGCGSDPDHRSHAVRHRGRGRRSVDARGLRHQHRGHERVGHRRQRLQCTRHPWVRTGARGDGARRRLSRRQSRRGRAGQQLLGADRSRRPHGHGLRADDRRGVGHPTASLVEAPISSDRQAASASCGSCWFFFPMFVLGEDQLHRVLETAVKTRYAGLADHGSGPASSTLSIG